MCPHIKEPDIGHRQSNKNHRKVLFTYINPPGDTIVALHELHFENLNATVALQQSKVTTNLMLGHTPMSLGRVKRFFISFNLKRQPSISSKRN